MYRTIHMIRCVTPDDRLANARIAEDNLLIFEYRAWHIHPALVRQMADLSSAVAESGTLDLDPERVANCLEPAICEAWLDQVPPEMNNGEPMRYRCLFTPGKPALFELRVRSDMVDPALIREMNEVVLPIACSALIPALNL